MEGILAVLVAEWTSSLIHFQFHPKTKLKMKQKKKQKAEQKSQQEQTKQLAEMHLQQNEWQNQRKTAEAEWSCGARFQQGEREKSCSECLWDAVRVEGSYTRETQKCLIGWATEEQRRTAADAAADVAVAEKQEWMQIESSIERNTIGRPFHSQS